jgi:hypothetical protein
MAGILSPTDAKNHPMRTDHPCPRHMNPGRRGYSGVAPICEPPTSISCVRMDSPTWSMMTRSLEFWHWLDKNLQRLHGSHRARQAARRPRQRDCRRGSRRSTWRGIWCRKGTSAHRNGRHPPACQSISATGQLQPTIALTDEQDARLAPTIVEPPLHSAVEAQTVTLAMVQERGGSHRRLRQLSRRLKHQMGHRTQSRCTTPRSGARFVLIAIVACVLVILACSAGPSCSEC